MNGGVMNDDFTI